MMAHWFRKAHIAAVAAMALLATSCGGPAAPPAPKTEFNIGWSIYAGWVPWAYAQQAGIVKKWADK
jgi:NitT/TauT family transport system substrate-binding protein